MKKSFKPQQIIKYSILLLMLFLILGCPDKDDKLPNYTLIVNAQPVDGGVVNLNPKMGTYPEGTVVSLSPQASVGYQFASWSGADAALVNGNKIEMSKNMNLNANFTHNSYTVVASVNPENSGSISGTGAYDHGQTVTLTASPDDGYEFTDWTEGGVQVSVNAAYAFTITANRTLVAHFSIKSFLIEAEVYPVNSGSVSGAGTYDYGQTVTLTASPAEGYEFEEWTEGSEELSSNATYSFTADADRSLVAYFEELPQNKIRLQTGQNLNNGSSIYFVALSENVNYFDLTTDQVFAYDKTNADWYIDGGVIPFTTDYKDFTLSTGTYYFMMRASGMAVRTTITVDDGLQTILIYGTSTGNVGISMIDDDSNALKTETKSVRIEMLKRK